ncbi:MAG TPA: hypothetical protein DCQ34_06930 [Chitinophagaceae bacterium]|nr:hypothetical protein [Chitinophagaceae bacterium]
MIINYVGKPNRPLFCMPMVIGLLIFACLYSIGASAQQYAVGKRNISFTDPSRSNRNIPFECYYPADQAGNNVPLASGAQKFPIVVFGHGFVIPASAYAWLGDSLARNGYVVAVPTTESGFLPSHGAFGKDLYFLCAQLKAENSNSSSFLYQRVWPKAAVAGHSMGGGSSILAAAEGPAVDAVFNFAAAETNPSATSAALLVNKPNLFFSGSNDCIVAPSVQTAMFNNIPNSCKTQVNITGATHCQFSNNNGTCVFGQISSGCNSSPISTTQVFGNIMDILLPFLDYHVKDICIRGQSFLQALQTQTGSVITNNCTSFPSCGVVPVRLIDFRAHKLNNRVEMQWTVDQETGMNGYAVERSLDGRTFQQISFYPARNRTSSLERYDAHDQNPAGNGVWYRLHMKQMDGRESYSPIVRLSATTQNLEILSSGPLTNGQAYLTIYAPVQQVADYILIDMMGRYIDRNRFLIKPGTNKYTIARTASLSPGIYQAMLIAEGGKNISKTSLLLL